MQVGRGSTPSPQRVLLTGATGFIGSAVARRCVEAGHDVVVLTRLAGRREHLEPIAGRLRFVQGDLLTAPPALPPESIDLCIHLAWDVTPGAYLEAAVNRQHLRATIDLGKALVAAGCRRIVGVGTCFEYEATEDGTMTEGSPTRPRSLYGQCKLHAFEALQSLCREAGVELAWARLFYQYGPAEHPQRVIPYIIRSLLSGRPAELTGGEQIRDFLHVQDVADALLAVAQSPLAGAVNIGSGEGVTIADLARQIGEILERPDLIHLGARPTPPHEPRRIVADNQLLRTGTAWQPRCRHSTGLRGTIGWWKRRLAFHG